MWVHVIIKPSAIGTCNTRKILSGVQGVWVQSSPSPRLVAIPKLKKTSLPILDENLSNDYGQIEKCQTVTFGIWTRVNVFISYDVNHGTIDAYSIFLYEDH